MTKKKAATKPAEETTAPPADEKPEAPKEKAKIRFARPDHANVVDGTPVEATPPKRAKSAIYPEEG